MNKKGFETTGFLLNLFSLIKMYEFRNNHLNNRKAWFI